LSAKEVDDDGRDNDGFGCDWSRRGEDLETVSRALGVTAATLTAWRDSFLAGGEAALASRPTDGEMLESERLKARLGDMLLKHELLEQKITNLEGGRPLARRRWKR
jgi:transposase-like protein